MITNAEDQFLVTAEMSEEHGINIDLIEGGLEQDNPNDVARVVGGRTRADLREVIPEECLQRLRHYGGLEANAT